MKSLKVCALISAALLLLVHAPLTAATLRTVALSGQSAPGTPSGVNYLSLDSFVLNAAGQTAFWASLTGSGVNSTNNRGIWATDLGGVLQLIARQGDLLEVAPADFRTISGLSFIGNSGNEDGRSSDFNDRGQVAFYASFTDGSSGVFVSNLVAVPEPASFALVALLGGLVCLSRARK